MLVCWCHRINLTKVNEAFHSQHLPVWIWNNNTEMLCKRCSRLMKKNYNSLKRNWQDNGQLFLVHFRGDWHSGTACCTQEKLFLDVESVYIMWFHVKSNLLEVYTQFFNSILKGTLMSILETSYNFLCIKIMHWKFYSLIPLKRNSSFMKHLVIGY